MKRKESRFILSLLVAFVIVFALVPQTSLVANAATDEITLYDYISGIKKDKNGQTVYSETFAADENMRLEVEVVHTSYDYRDTNYELILTAPSGKTVEPTSGIPGQACTWVWETDKMTEAGNYTLSLVCGYTGLGSCGYRLTGHLREVHNYTYKFSSFSAEVEPHDYYEYIVKFTYGDFDKPENEKPEVAIYRLSDGKVYRLSGDAWSDNRDTGIKRMKKYKYYIAGYAGLSDFAKSVLPEIYDKVDATEDVMKALEETTASNEVETPGFDIPPVEDLTYEAGVKSAKLSWNYNVPNGLKNVTGYKIERFTYSGTLKKTFTVVPDYLFYLDKTIYIPYSGTAKVKVTPFYDHEGQRLYGEGMTISCKSAKIRAAGGGVTKISNTRAAITVIRPEEADGVQVQQKVKGKWNNITSGTTKKIYRKAVTKNSAGKSTYRFRSYIKDNGKKYYSSWNTFTPKSNQATYTKWAVSYIRDLYGLGSYWYPSKIYYSKGKIKVEGRFLNTWRLAGSSCKAKITFKCDGKTIGYQTVSAKVPANTAKTVKFTLKNSKKNIDLRNGPITYHVNWIKK